MISLMDETNQDDEIVTNGDIIHIANGYAAHYDGLTRGYMFL